MATKKTMNFKSKGSYNNWVKHGQATGAFSKSPGNTPVKINGKSHTVNHSTKSKTK